MKKYKQLTRQITEGAVFVAIYALLAIISRYLITGTDSLIYYFLPLPLAIYSARNPLKLSIIVLLASIALCFLFANPIYVLMLFIPNLIIGFIFGILEIRQKNKLINYILIFVLCFLADYLSICAYEYITQVSYWEDIVEPVTKLFSNIIDEETIRRLISIASIAVLMVDSLIKEILLYCLFVLIVKRLQLIKEYNPSFKVKLIYQPSVTIIYIFLFIILGILMQIFLINESIVINILIVLLLVCIFIVSFYLMYQALLYIRIKLKNNTALSYILMILGIILFPILIILGLILNLIKWNFINAAL